MELSVGAGRCCATHRLRAVDDAQPDLASSTDDADGALDPPSGPLLLVDGNSLAYRAFFALPDTIATADGFPTNALYGLAAMMVKVLAEQRPGRVVVAWDPPKGAVFRHERYPAYKAGRSTTPDLLREQKPRFPALMEAFGFVNVEAPGFEADDVIGTLATQAAEAGQPVLILTGDRDALQLVDEHISVLATGRGVTDTTLYTPAAVEERYGVPPSLMTDFRGIVGDSSDNLPGVKGIGEKGAAQLIQKYGSLDAVLAAAEDQTPKRRQMLIECADDALVSRELARIVRDVPLEITPDDVPPLRFGAVELARLRDVFEQYEFGSLVRRLGDLAEGAAPVAAPVARRRTAQVQPCEAASLAFSLAGVETAALAVSDGRFAVAVPSGEVWVGDLGEGDAALLGAALTAVTVSCHDAKALPAALVDAGVTVAHDTMVAGYVLAPRRRGYPLDELATEAGVDVEADDPVARAAGLTADLAAWQQDALDRDDMRELFDTIEMPLVAVLRNMERTGVTLDVVRLGEIAARVRDQIDELRDRIWEMAGEQFVIDSPKQLGHILFEVLGLPTFRKGKTGFSTDRQVLKLLEKKHPIIGEIGQYRELTKLDNTYLAALPQLVDADGRLHTTFNQTVAETGRLSSTNPNLQNIPVRTALGREIRDAFVAPEGHVLISADYSQVELRILAHASGEPTLAEAFRRGEDVHRATAAEVFGMAPGDVDRTTRDRAKAVNFGIVYGISDFGLSEQLSIPRSDAKAYIETYLARYPRVRSFIDTTIAAAAQDGRVTTLLGRTRPIPELTGRTVQQRQLGERLAVNTVIQGTAADIIKVAMIRVHDALQREGCRARLILQIHDELLFEAPADECEHVVRLAREAMVGAYPLDPPLAVDIGIGETWMDAKA